MSGMEDTGLAKSQYGIHQTIQHGLNVDLKFANIAVPASYVRGVRLGLHKKSHLGSGVWG